MKPLAKTILPQLDESVGKSNLYLVEQEKTDHILVYRPDIDGLRALAVLSVLVYHLFPEALPGGFVGVDIFFVISGYLISSIIFKSLLVKNFSLLSFYTKRIKRIFPTLLIVLFSVYTFSNLISTHLDYLSVLKYIWSTALFMTNISLYMEVGYFDLDSIRKPLLHMWSLSLEEQFYIFFPVVVMVLFQYRKLLFSATALGFAASFLINIYYININQPAVFYFLPSRAWELLLGSIYAYYCVFTRSSQNSSVLFVEKIRSHPYSCNTLATFGAALILYSITMYEESRFFPGWMAVLPTFGALSLVVANNSWLNKNILSHKAFVFVGLISYSLYLWHWPILSLSYEYWSGDLTLETRFVIFALTFILATVTTFAIEKPIRNSNGRVIVYLVSAMVFICAISYVTSHLRIKPLWIYLYPNIEKQLSKLDEAKEDWSYEFLNLPSDPKRNLIYPSIGIGNRIIAFFGDSNIEQYWPRVEKLMESDDVYNNNTVTFLTYGGQVPIPNSHVDSQNHKEFLEKAISHLDNPNIESVVFGANWVGYFKRDSLRADEYWDSLGKLIKKLTEKGKKVYIISNIPITKEQDPRTMLSRSNIFFWSLSPRVFDLDDWSIDADPILDKLKQVAEDSGAVIIEPLETLCPLGKCIARDQNDKPLYKDSAHLRASYAKEYATYIDKIFGQ